MKVRNEASTPTLISPSITLLPPTHRTRPMAAKYEKLMALVFATRMSVRSCASSSALADAWSNFAISWPCAAKARTTRMPPRFSSMTRLTTARRSCRVSQAARSLSCVTDERQATKGTKLRLSSPSTTIGADKQVGADADQDRQQHQADEAGGEEHAHAVDVEDAERDEVAGVNAIVEAEAQALQLLVAGQAELVADLVADGLAVIVLQQREEAAQDADTRRIRAVVISAAPAPPSTAATTPWAWSTACPSRRGMASCRVAATNVETMATLTCQGWRSVMRVMRRIVPRPRPHWAAAACASELSRLAASAIELVVKESAR